MEERRQKERIPADLEILACTPSIHPESRITNISCKGAFISAASPLPVDAELSMHIQIPNDPELIELSARVVWTKTHENSTAAGMGVQFIHIAPQDREKLAALINQHQ